MSSKNSAHNACNKCSLIGCVQPLTTLCQSTIGYDQLSIFSEFTTQRCWRADQRKMFSLLVLPPIWSSRITSAACERPVFTGKWYMYIQSQSVCESRRNK